MPRMGDINHVPDVYLSVCCGVERSIPDNMKVPPCPGDSKSGGGNALARMPPGLICVGLQRNRHELETKVFVPKGEG